jgi:membrane-bound lytic murein transglycosylase D
MHGLLIMTPIILAALLLSGCSPTLQETSLAESRNQGEDPNGYASSSELGPEELYQIEEDIEQAENELEPLADEEIPLPEPAELAALEENELLPDHSADIEKPEIKYDFPITINAEVEYFLDRFQNSQPKMFRRWLERSGRYVPMIQEELAKAGMPLDLAYLPMIESGYRLTAYSRARAVGPWQFIRGTGRRHGLTINNYIDERRDPIKATKAAIKYLSKLYEEFNSWELATAGYNAGEGRIRKAIRKTGSRDFWVHAKSKHLKKETKYYVPKLIAAIIIARDPESYGFTDIEYDAPLAFETLKVPRWTTMQAISVAAGEPLEDIRNLNRQLRRAITPPGSKYYTIKVPVGKKERVASNLPRVKAIVTTGYKTHVIKRGDSVSRICRKYNINKKTLLKANNLRSSKLIAGKRLRIPYRTTAYKLVDKSVATASLKPAEMMPENLIIHTIQPGETVSELSKRYNAPAHMIAAWNGLHNLNRIRAGQQLAFYLTDVDNAKMQQLASLNKKRPARTQEPIHTEFSNNTDTLDNKNGPGRLTYYHVRGGDTLWTIARRFQTTPEKIRRWNNINGDKIIPGRKLLLKTYDEVEDV